MTNTNKKYERTQQGNLLVMRMMTMISRLLKTAVKTAIIVLQTIVQMMICLKQLVMMIMVTVISRLLKQHFCPKNYELLLADCLVLGEGNKA